MIALLIGMLSAFPFIFACSPGASHNACFYDLFDTVISLTVYSDMDVFQKMKGEAEESFTRYDRLYDIYEEYEGTNNLATVNRMAGNAVIVEEEIIDLLELGVEYWRITEGKVNVAMGAVLRLWHDCRKKAEDDPLNASLPGTEALEEASKHCSIDDLVIDRSSSTVTLMDPYMSLDAGATAKGYAADKVAEKLKEYNVPFLLNCGGAVYAFGKKPGNAEWKAGIDDPNGDGFTAIVTVDDCALSTSGSYLRKYEVNGREYGHIIDPETLFPSDLVVSVSVVFKGMNCSATADALSTACFILGTEEGIKLIEKTDNAEALFLLKDGSTVKTDGFPSND